MKKIVILMDSKQYSYHSAIADLLLVTLQAEEHSVSILDINSEKHDHLLLAALENFKADILITLDLAGFRFRTQSGESALNMLCTKNLNLVWGDKPEYAPLLERKISLSMLFYDALGTDCGLPAHYPNLLYYKYPARLKEDFASAADYVQNQEAFHIIWKDFLTEALLSEA